MVGIIVEKLADEADFDSLPYLLGKDLRTALEMSPAGSVVFHEGGDLPARSVGSRGNRSLKLGSFCDLGYETPGD
jgi:hypothetical protein